MTESWDRKPVKPGADKSHTAGGDTPGPKEWKLIEKVVLTHSNELRRSRRWGIVFKSLTFIYLFALLYFIFMANGGMPRGPVSTGGHVAVVEMHGQIADNMDISVELHRQPLINAFEHPETQAVVLDINSPGGSPVQAQQLYTLIQELKTRHETIPVYAVIGDLGASGAYYIAAAADEIYASGASLVGSIGVISGSFGFDRAMDDLGIDRRLYTAGESKAFLDMFSPENESEVAHWQGVLDNVHEQFIADVQAGRGDRLSQDEDLYTGLMWSGEQAVERGLADGLDSVYSLASRLEIDELLYFEPERDPWRQLLDDFGMSVGRGAMSILSADNPPTLR